MRSFTKVATITINTSALVLLKDAAGSGILCNYVEVIPTSVSTATGYFQTYVSGVGQTTPVSGITANGYLGKAGRVYEPVVLNLDYGDECSAIAIVNKLSVGNDFIVNYGVTKPRRSKYLLEAAPNLGNK